MCDLLCIYTMLDCGNAKMRGKLLQIPYLCMWSGFGSVVYCCRGYKSLICLLFQDYYSHIIGHYVIPLFTLGENVTICAIPFWAYSIGTRVGYKILRFNSEVMYLNHSNQV